MRKSIKKNSDGLIGLKLIKKLGVLFLNSLISALFAFTLIYFVTNLAALYFAYDFDIPAHFDLYNLIIEKTNHWEGDAMITVLVSKPVSALLLGILTLVALMFIRKKLVSFFFFLVWLILFAFNSAVGIMIDDVIVKSGTYDIAEKMHFDSGILVLLSLTAIYFLYRMGMICFYILESSFPQFFANSYKTRVLFLTVIILLPWFFIFLIPFADTSNAYPLITFLKNSSMIFLILPLFIQKKGNNSFRFAEPLWEIRKYDYLNLALFVLGTFLLAYFMIDGVYISGG